MKEQVEFEVLDGLSKDFMPSCKTKLSAGLDVKTTQGFTLEKFEHIIVGLGVKIKHMPSFLYPDLEIRSGKRFKNLCCTLGTGIIDGDFFNEMEILIFNFGEKVTFKKGDGVGQLILRRNYTQEYASKYCLENIRKDGFGSTDKK